jgi:hypothetical protein
LKAVINTIDSTLYNLRPSSGMTLQVPSQTSYTTAASAPPTSQAWGPQMWSIIDKEMTLKECTVYCWAPPDEPFEEEEGSIWSLNYFFFNKERKRVAYIYVRGVPVMTHSPRPHTNMSKRAGSEYDSGANKRMWSCGITGKIQRQTSSTITPVKLTMNQRKTSKRNPAA